MTHLIFTFSKSFISKDNNFLLKEGQVTLLWLPDTSHYNILFPKLLIIFSSKLGWKLYTSIFFSTLISTKLLKPITSKKHAPQNPTTLMKKIILEKKINPKLAVFSLERLALAHIEAWIWILACVSRMYILSAFQQCEYSYACKFLGMGEDNMIFSKEHVFYLLKSLLNLIQPGTKQNLPFTVYNMLLRVPENKARKLTLSFARSHY